MDSGVGGLSVLREIRKLLPGNHYIYYSDNANCPYGEKSPEFIRQRCFDICSMFIERGASAVVIACNTATAAAINYLRREFDIPFIGVEPAIKPATRLTRSGTIGVLATAGTLHSERYLKLKAAAPEDIRVVEHVGEGFVEAVENGKLSGNELEKMVWRSLEPLLEAGADTIVLGCTHYPFLSPVMRKLAPQVQFIEPATAIAQQLKTVLSKLGKSAIPDSPTAAQATVELLSSGDLTALERTFALISQ